MGVPDGFNSGDRQEDGDFYFSIIDRFPDAMEGALVEVLDETDGYEIKRWTFCEGWCWQLEINGEVPIETLIDMKAWIRSRGPMKPAASSSDGRLRWWQSRPEALDEGQSR